MNPQSGVNLGSAYGDIVIGDNIDAALDKATRGFDNALSRIGDSISRVGDTMTRAGTSIQVAMLPVEALFAKGLDVASNYEDALKEIEARAGLTGEQLAMVSEKALQLGADTSFSAQQAADAFLQLLTSGSSLEEAMVQIDAVMAGAAANGTELGFTADALTDVMAAFQVEVGQSAEVMQALTAASSASSATFPDLIQAFASGGSVAHDFGMSVEETAAALAVLHDNGIKGAEAGTQLKSMLTNMSRQTDDVTGMWDRLGVSMYDAQGNMRDLDDIIKDLNVAMAGMNDEERNNVLQTLAGSYGRVGLSALLAADGIDTMNGRMDEQGTMEDIAAARLDTYSGAVDALMGTLETLSIKVMTPFMNDVLKPNIQRLTEIINKVGDWADANKPLVMIILKVVSALFALGPVLIGLGVALQIIGPAVTALGVALGFLMSPITLVIAGVMALAYVFQEPLGAAIQTGMGWLSAFSDFIHFFVSDVQNSGLGKAILAIFGEGEVGRVTGSSLEGLLQKLGFSADTAQEITDDVFQVFAHWFIKVRNIFARVQAVVGGPLGKIQDMISMFFSALKVGQPVLTALGSSIGAVFGNNPVITGFLNSAIEKFNEFREAISSTFERITNAVGSALEQIGIFIGNNLGNIMAFAWSMFDLGRTILSLTNPIGILSAVFKVLGVDLLDVFVNVIWAVDAFFLMLNNGTEPLRAFALALDGLFGSEGNEGNITRFFATIGNWIGQLWGWINNTAIPALKSFGAWFMNEGLPAVVSYVTDTVMPAINSFITTVSDIWTRVQPGLTSLGNWFMVDVLPQVMSILTDSLIPLLESVISWLGDLWLIAQPHLLALADWFLVTGLPLIQTFISDTVLPVVQGLIDGLSALWLDVSPYLTSLFDWFMNTGLPAIKDFIFDDVMPVVTNLIGLLADIWKETSPYFLKFYDWFMVTGLPAILDFLTGHFTDELGIVIELIKGFLGLVDGAITKARELMSMNPTENQAMSGLTGATFGGGDWFAALFGGNAAAMYNNQSPNISGAGTLGGSRDGGGRGYPGVSYMIGTGAQPEMYIPDSPGTFVPNADQLGSKNFYLTIESITAANMQEAQMLGDAFGNAFMNKLHNSGYAEDY